SAPVVIMLVRTLRTSFTWHPAVPQLRAATRRSPGLTNRTQSAVSCIQRAYARTGAAEERASRPKRGSTGARGLACRYPVDPAAAPDGAKTAALPKWQAVQAS